MPQFDMPVIADASRSALPVPGLACHCSPSARRACAIQRESIAFVKSHTLIGLAFFLFAKGLRILVRASGDKTALLTLVSRASFSSKP